MKGIVFTDKGKAHVVDDISSPKLEHGDVLTKTRTSGVSTGTELNFLTGDGFGRRRLCLDLAEKYACERVFSGL